MEGEDENVGLRIFLSALARLQKKLEAQRALRKAAEDAKKIWRLNHELLWRIS
jgi:hypothetical protein